MLLIKRRGFVSGLLLEYWGKRIIEWTGNSPVLGYEMIESFLKKFFIGYRTNPDVKIDAILRIFKPTAENDENILKPTRNEQLVNQVLKNKNC